MEINIDGKTGVVLGRTTPVFSELDETIKGMIKYYKEGKKLIFFTVSPSIKKKIKVERITTGYKKKTYNLCYGIINHKEQIGYIDNYMKYVYLIPLRDIEFKMVYIYELNEQNNIHIHGLIYSKELQTEYDLNNFRRMVSSHPFTIQNMVINKQKRFIDWMNNIVYYDETKKDIEIYLKKQPELLKKYNFIFYNNIIV